MVIKMRDIKYNIDGYLYNFIPENYDNVEELNNDNLEGIIDNMKDDLHKLQWELDTDTRNKYTTLFNNITKIINSIEGGEN